MKIAIGIAVVAVILIGGYYFIGVPTSNPILREALKREPVNGTGCGGMMTIQVTAFAVNPTTKQVKEFSLSCAIPKGWIPLTNNETEALRESGVIK